MYPLELYVCETCYLVQLLDVVDREQLFRNYIYLTGTSETIAAHNAEYARTIVDLLQLGASDLVVEVASNDGSLLTCFRRQGVRVLGIEPATNIAALAAANGIETINRFFSSSVASDVKHSHGPASVVIANNVLAHLDDPRDFLDGCRDLIGDEGLVVIEVPALDQMMERLEYDTIYHEHLSYFSLSSMAALCEAAALAIVRIDRLPVHGGSLRVYATRKEKRYSHAPEVATVLGAERAQGLCSLERYRSFAGAVARNRLALRSLLTQLRAEGKTLAGYGAPAKGNTLLNYCGIGTDLLPFTVDKSPLKVGLETPGMHIPVLPVAELLERQPDYVVILPWNLAEEIVDQQREFRDRGGRFIIPIPEPRII
jgi:SAM-dependent methyltransferase